MLFKVNTGLRSDEAWWLEYRDVAVVDDNATGESTVGIEVRGKRGGDYCKSMAGAVRPFERLKMRNTPEERDDPESTDLVFPKRRRELFNTILEEDGLGFDREVQRRTAYSLRLTFIHLRLLECADICQIAKNCHNNVEMIEKYYAPHISTAFDAAAIYIRHPRSNINENKVR